jgi:MoaA/NifB/PqqE/SkfB family radical SAM enzyme
MQEAFAHGFQHISFTGGEPTLHPAFTAIIEKVHNAGYTFGFVSNGWNFTSVYHQLLPYLKSLADITFSLDGAGEETHDRVRGKGSFRRLMSAVSICVMKDIPFTFNTLITSNNCNELVDIADLAQELGGRGIRFGHLIATPRCVEFNLDLSPADRREIDSDIKKLQNNLSFPLGLAPGYYTNDLFPCDPLQKKEVNVDWRGNITMCCHLSGYGNGSDNLDVIGDLEDMDFSEAHERLVVLNREFKQKKRMYFNGGNVSDSDYFPCWYCMNYFGKTDWLKAFPQNAWYDSLWKDNDKRTEKTNDRVKSESKT